MLSIFDQKDFDQPPEKKMTLNRLQGVLGPPVAKVEKQRPQTSALAEPPPVAKLAQVPAPAIERRAAPPESEPISRLAPAAQKDDTAVPAELHEFADQFTRGFREVLVNTVRDLQAPAAEERKRMDSALDSVARTARDVENLNAGLEVAFQKIEDLAKALKDMSAQNCEMADTVKAVSASAHAIHEAQRSLETRVEAQAAALRGLNESLRSSEDRLEGFFRAFQSMQGAASERSARRSLPDNL